MNNYFELLKDILAIPKNIYNINNYKEWSKFEEKLGIVLPNDYKYFITTYGTVSINNFIWFLTPFSKDENINYLKKMNIMLQSYSISKKIFPEYFIHNIYPEKDGILPWGYTENGDELYWKTSEKDNWEIVIYESRSSNFCIYKMEFTEFIYKLITKEIVCEAFPDDFLS